MTARPHSDQLSRFFDVEVPEGSPLQSLRRAFIDDVYGLLLGADLRRLALLMTLIGPFDDLRASHFPAPLHRPDDGELDVVHALDPIYRLAMTDEGPVARMLEGVHISQLLGAFAAWQFVELCDHLEATPHPRLDVIDPLLERIHLAIAHGTERLMDQQFEEAVGAAAERIRMDDRRSQSRSLAQKRWSRATEDRATAVRIAMELQGKLRHRSDAARRVLQQLRETSSAVYELKTIDKWLKQAGWTSGLKT